MKTLYSNGTWSVAYCADTQKHSHKIEEEKSIMLHEKEGQLRCRDAKLYGYLHHQTTTKVSPNHMTLNIQFSEITSRWLHPYSL